MEMISCNQGTNDLDAYIDHVMDRQDESEWSRFWEDDLKLVPTKE